jgi:hypothetical protein
MQRTGMSTLARRSLRRELSAAQSTDVGVGVGDPRRRTEPARSSSALARRAYSSAVIMRLPT